MLPRPPKWLSSISIGSPLIVMLRPSPHGSKQHTRQCLMRFGGRTQPGCSLTNWHRHSMGDKVPCFCRLAATPPEWCHRSQSKNSPRQCPREKSGQKIAKGEGVHTFASTSQTPPHGGESKEKLQPAKQMQSGHQPKNSRSSTAKRNASCNIFIYEGWPDDRFTFRLHRRERLLLQVE